MILRAHINCCRQSKTLDHTHSRSVLNARTRKDYCTTETEDAPSSLHDICRSRIHHSSLSDVFHDYRIRRRTMVEINSSRFPLSHSIWLRHLNIPLTRLRCGCSYLPIPSENPFPHNTRCSGHILDMAESHEAAMNQELPTSPRYIRVETQSGSS